MVSLLVVFLAFGTASSEEKVQAESASCLGLPISHFESRFPTKIKRLTFDDNMVETFLELWRNGSRPDLPKRPERVVIYALPGLPLIVGYQERHCIIAYLAIDSAALSRWLHQHLGWNT
jgi:hypothetical protein